MANREHFHMLRQGVEAWNTWKHIQKGKGFRADLRQASLSGAKLRYIDLSFADLSEADLSGADLNDADLFSVNLNSANLSGASLRFAKFIGTDLSNANLSNADLSFANLNGGVELGNTDLNGTSINNTTFGDLDLRMMKGLEMVKHEGPSTIGSDTLMRSEGHIPEIFLRGAGVPDTFIEYARSLVAHPIEYYTVFISYSSKNQDFAERLYTNLQQKGVRCWFAPEDLKIGAKIRSSIDESIRLYDKLLLVLSQYSVASQWVEQEVEAGLAKERKENRTVLFPIRLDNTVMLVEGGWPALIRNTRNIGDFSRWKQHDAYQKALNRLLRDLKAETSQPKM